MYLLGYDIGSSSVKASLVDAASGKCVSSAFYPKTEAPILAVKQGWAEQDPESWWTNLKLATQAVLHESGAYGRDVKAIGISYQMHGLVCVDTDSGPLKLWGRNDAWRICSIRRVTSLPPSWRGSRKTSRRCMNR